VSGYEERLEQTNSFIEVEEEPVTYITGECDSSEAGPALGFMRRGRDWASWFPHSPCRDGFE
jgi:hypothetical protein